MSTAQWVDDHNEKDMSLGFSRLVGWWASIEDTHFPDRLCAGKADI